MFLSKAQDALAFLDNFKVSCVLDGNEMWVQDRAYSDLMRELWGSPGQWNVRKKYAEVARKLGVDEETVRNRINHLRESGFLLGWRLVPNPMLLGRKSTFLFLDFGEAELKEETIPRLKKMNGVLVISSIYDKSILLSLLDDEAGSCSKQVADMGIKAEILTVPGMGFPPSSFRIKPTDWEIIRLLLRNAEMKVTDVATEVKISPRTVKRRLNEMLSASAIFIMPLVNLGKSGGVNCNLMVQSEDGRKTGVERVVSSRIDNLVFRASDSKNGLIFGFTAPNITEGNEILKWIKHQPGVKSVRMNIVEQVVHVFDWIEDEVKKRAAVG